MRVALITPDRAYHPFVTMIVEGLRARGDEFFASDPGNGLTDEEVLGYEPGFIQAAQDADACLVFFGKSGSMAAGSPKTREPKYDLVTRAELPRERVAYLDYSEMTASGKPTEGQVSAMRKAPALRRGKPWLSDWALGACGHYFKRECFLDDELTAGVKPLAFGMIAEYDQPVAREKDVDLFCCFGHTETGLRKEIVKECERLRATRRSHRILVRDRMSKRDYMEAVRRSKIVVDAWGHGDQCYRFWEGMGGRACVLYQRYQVDPGPEWFTDGRDAVEYGSVKAFVENATLLLDEPLRTMELGAAGYRRAMAHHTGKARVDYIFREMGL